MIRRRFAIASRPGAGRREVPRLHRVAHPAPHISPSRRSRPASGARQRPGRNVTGPPGPRGKAGALTRNRPSNQEAPGIRDLLPSARTQQPRPEGRARRAGPPADMIANSTATVITTTAPEWAIWVPVHGGGVRGVRAGGRRAGVPADSIGPAGRRRSPRRTGLRRLLPWWANDGTKRRWRRRCAPGSGRWLSVPSLRRRSRRARRRGYGGGCPCLTF